MKAYRVGKWQGDRYLASEIIRYETEELGNDLGIDQDVLDYLEDNGVAGSKLLWVCLDRESVARYSDYGEVIELDLPDSTVVIGNDGYDNGYLILLLDNSELAGTKALASLDLP